MAKFKMKQLALALGMVAGSMSLIPSVQAVNLATDDLGQVLIFPYYTVRGGWNTLLNITNTSATDVVAFKIRFHEARNSRDVFDFNVFLSPNDVWSGWVQNDPGADGRVGTSDDLPRFFTNDNSCTAPAIPAAGQPFGGIIAYTGTAADGAGTTADRMQEGYVEIVMMGSANQNDLKSPAGTTLIPLAANAVHSKTTRTPLNCTALVNAFNNPNYAYFNQAAAPLPANGIAALRAEFPRYNSNPLKGAFSLVNGSEGWNATGSTTALANFFAPTSAVLGAAGTNLITFQLPPQGLPAFTDSYFLPDLSAGNTRGLVLRENGAVTESTAIGGADAVSFVLQRTNVVNQWARRTDAATGWLTSSDWVVNFPTKRFYVDRTTTHNYSASAPGTPGLPASAPAPFANNFTFGANYAGQSCDPVTFTIYDREEFFSTSGPVFSPSPVSSTSLCYETNVITFDGSNILGSAIPSNINDLPGDNGWINLVLNGGTNAANGLPVIGFSAITRSTSDGVLNEAFLVDHAYTRPAPPAAVGGAIASPVTGTRVY
jgi:hypothetical protein